jgi:ribosomal protein S18 acetylase RimI-like enzyme
MTGQLQDDVALEYADARGADLGGGFRLRRATTDDHAALSLICLKTGDHGNDATEREDDPDLLGAIYAVPYQVLEPDFAFVIEAKGSVCGYVLGALDTPSFNLRLEREWFAPLRQHLHDPGPDRQHWKGSDWARHLIHHPEPVFPASLQPYPSHGHIDLLPEAQGRGLGRKALEFMMQRLREAGSPGLFLGVSPANRRARHFYTKLGFETLRSDDLPPRSIYMARQLR